MARLADGVVCMEKGDRFVLVGKGVPNGEPMPTADVLEGIILPKVCIVLLPNQAIHHYEPTVVEIVSGRVVVREN